MTPLSALTLMVIDSCDDFRAAVCHELTDDYSIHQYSTGTEALEAIATLRPDAIVVDLILAGIDGISLLHEIRKMGIWPKVLVTTRLLNDYVASCIAKLDIGYILLKPCLPQTVAFRLTDLTKNLDPKPIIDPNVYLHNRLQELSFSTRHKGYQYLHEAALIMAQAPSTAITKELYPAIGQKFLSTPTQVERAIRTAINAAWEHRSVAWTELFPAEPGQFPPRPSNGVLIARLSEEIRQLTGMK